MPTTAGDALLASANVDGPDATLPEVPDPDKEFSFELQKLVGMVGFHVEAAESDRLPRLLDAAIKAHKPDSKKRTKLTICEGEDGIGSSLGDLLIFPDMIRYRALTHFDGDNFVEEEFLKHNEYSPGSPRVIRGSYIFVCGHGSMDIRCGVCGPALIERFKKEINRQGLDGQVAVSASSNMGGHEYAGNVIIFSSDAKGEMTGRWYSYVAPDDVPVLLHKHIGLGAILEHLLRGQLCLSEEQQTKALELRYMKNILTEEGSIAKRSQANGTGSAVVSMSECLSNARVIVIGHVRLSWGRIFYLDARNCFSWRFNTGEPLMVLSVEYLINPFPPQHSGIVRAAGSSHLRTLIQQGAGLWLSKPWRDWSGLPRFVLQDIFSRIICATSFFSASQTCTTWSLTASFVPRPVLLHPSAGAAWQIPEQWLFLTPRRSIRNKWPYRLFHAKSLNEQLDLVGGSGEHLIFFNSPLCQIVNIHTGFYVELPLPTSCSDVYRGTLSATPQSSTSCILLVTKSSILGKSVNGKEDWTENHFGDINVEIVDDIIYVGDTAYLIDNKGMLYTVTADFQIRLLHVGTACPGSPISKFGGRIRPKVVLHKNWLMEWRGELLRLSYWSHTLDAVVYSGFFMFRLGENPMAKFFEDKSKRYGLHYTKVFCPQSWERMTEFELGELCVLLNWGTPASSFVSHCAGRWGLRSGKIYQCAPDIVPWQSAEFGWLQEYSMIIPPQNTGWPLPLFMNSGFAFLPEDEVDYNIES